MKKAFLPIWAILSISLLLSCGCTTPAPTSKEQTPGKQEVPKEKTTEALTLNEQEYFSKPGLDVMAFSDFYPEGHQGGVTIVQHGVRVAANGDVRLESAPGQWQPVPKLDKRAVNLQKQTITTNLHYPDEAKNQKGFNPIVYPDLSFDYRVRVSPRGEGVRVSVDLDTPLPSEWIDKVGFNLELFPGEYFGRSFHMDGNAGIFPRQVNGPFSTDQTGAIAAQNLAEGKELTLAPEEPLRTLRITATKGKLILLDGRAEHNNGWFVVRSLFTPGATTDALVWDITPNTVDGWQERPRVHLSQIGYHPSEKKIAIIELDRRAKNNQPAQVVRIEKNGNHTTLPTKPLVNWGIFLRYRYLQLDFSAITQAGVYRIEYGNERSNIFRIDKDIYDRHVWQPTLEYFLPVQMCHMRVNDRYRVWHDRCHMDDAIMAPINTNHFDGYVQGDSTLTSYSPGQPVPGLNGGGWHDAGDYDLRIESQIGTVRLLASIYELFHIDYDATTIDPKKQVVEMHRPDGVPDILQQVAHGVTSIIGAYQNMGRLYRGIICPTNRQYVMLGDAAAMTDNLSYDSGLLEGEIKNNRSGNPDDRWVFTEDNPERALHAAAGLAAASRVLADYNPQMAQKCLHIARSIHQTHQNNPKAIEGRIDAATELLLATGEATFRAELTSLGDEIVKHFAKVAPTVGQIIGQMDVNFQRKLSIAATALAKQYRDEAKETPFGLPYKPNIWGAGWDIQRFGVTNYMLYRAWPKLFDPQHTLNALHFVLGNHPGRNTTSFVSGVGVNSLTVAYGVNRADWSHIPGGVGSGTALIRPDLPELKEWPFFWQQSEYVMGGGGSNFMFLTIAANQMMHKNKQ